MKITKTSMVTGKEHTREIDVTQQQIRAWQDGMLIQQTMPNLSADEREFIMTGITAEEWDDVFHPGGDVPPADHGKELK